MKIDKKVDKSLNISDHNTLRDALKIYLKELGFTIKNYKFISKNTNSWYIPDIVAYKGIDKFIFEIIFSHLSHKIFDSIAGLEGVRKILVVPTRYFYNLKKRPLGFYEIEKCFKLIEMKEI
jgi:5-bromo-4-chloroindolyl phosphate hydrolysis protein